MKKIKILVFLLLLIIPFSIKAESKVDLYLFYGDGCPHCAEEEEFLDKYLKENDDVELHKYEVWYNDDNKELLEKIKEVLKDDSTGVPYMIIGNDPIIGYTSGITDEKIKCHIRVLKDNDNYVDLVKKVINDEDITEDDENNGLISFSDDMCSNMELPILGKVNVKDVSLPLVALVMGLVDGFNPCAMWILIFLLSILIGMKNRKKLILYGLVFILTSGLFYFLLMFTWLKVITNLSVSLTFRMIIAIFALGAGIYNLVNYFKSLKKVDGCTVTNPKQRKSIMLKVKKFTQEKNVLIALLGIITLAISVNFVELLCSAGLPMVYTEILSINKVSGGMQVVYNLIYIFFFLIDDLIIFLIAAKTMNIKAISTKLTKYSHLAAGIIMFIIGILLILKPEWVMFNF